ncbi:32724_t:CDS:2, partial [Racocetra persica]
QVDNILNKEKSEESSTKKLRLDYEDESSDENKSLTTSKVESKKIDHFLAQDKSVIEHYRWLNPHLVLPSRK